MNELSKYIQEITAIGALLGGAMLQYIFGVGKGAKVILIIVLSTAFLALFVLTPLMDYLNGLKIFNHTLKIGSDSPLRILVYALSSLISVEAIALIIKFLPKALQDRVLNKMGVSNE